MIVEKLQNNKTLRTGIILTLIAIITLVALAMTFAKYAVQGTGQDEARVAKWGLNLSVPNNLNLFDQTYTSNPEDPDSSITVDSSDESNVIAPGTHKEVEITLASYKNNQAPEVMYHFEPTLKVETVGSGTNLLQKLNENRAFTWILYDASGVKQEYQNVFDLQNAVSAMGESDIAPNTFPKNFGGNSTPKIKIGWNWAFQVDGNANDASDTELGNLVAKGQLSGLKTTLVLNAYQCQGCSAQDDPKLNSGVPGPDASICLEVGQTSDTYIASSDSGAAISVDSNNSAIASVAPAAANGNTQTYQVKGLSVGNTNITVSVPAYGQYRAANIDVPVYVTGPVKTKVTKPTPISPSPVYNSSEQNGVNLGPDSGKFHLISGQEKATNAGNYFATYQLNDPNTTEWEDGTIEDCVVNWNITKAVNPIEVTTPQDTSSIYDPTNDVTRTIIGATKAQGNVTYTIKYSVTGFSINNTTVTCAAGTNADEKNPYNLTIVATAAGNENYEPGSKEITYEWTVHKAQNPMTFTLDQSSYTSDQSDASVAFTFTAAQNAPEGSTVTYDASSTASTEENFYIPDPKTQNVLVCAEDTGVDTYTITLKATASETQNYNKGVRTQEFTWTVKTAVALQPIQRTYSWYTSDKGCINFLPAFNDDQLNTVMGSAKFCDKDGNELTDLNEARSMSQLASAIDGLDGKAASVYVKGTPTKPFYGTINQSWNNTFYQATAQAGYAKGLQSSGDPENPKFKENLDKFRLKTVYFKNNVDTTPTSEGNWDCQGGQSTTTMPQLGGVDYGKKESSGYTGFYGAYSYNGVSSKSLLSSYASNPWSSRAYDGRYAYYWDANYGYWLSSLRPSTPGVVLSLAF